MPGIEGVEFFHHDGTYIGQPGLVPAPIGSFGNRKLKRVKNKHSAAITAGQAVRFDTALYDADDGDNEIPPVRACSAANDTQFAGVALEAADGWTSGDYPEFVICIEGEVTSADVATGTSASAALITTTTAGALGAAGAVTADRVATALTAESGGKAKVVVLRSVFNL